MDRPEGHKDKIGPKTLAVLKAHRYQDHELGQFTGDTRLLHDMRLSGDDIDDLVRIAARCGHDMQEIDFSAYFPSELSTDALIVSWHPALRIVGLGGIVDRTMSHYRPLTLDEHERLLVEKRADIKNLRTS